MKIGEIAQGLGLTEQETRRIFNSVDSRVRLGVSNPQEEITSETIQRFHDKEKAIRIRRGRESRFKDEEEWVSMAAANCF